MLDPIVVRTEATGPMLTYLEERAAAFPGVTLARSYIRHYPHGSVAAQLLGYDGQISQQQLKTLAGHGYEPGDEIGQDGVESALGHVPAWGARVGPRPRRLSRPSSQSPVADGSAPAGADGAPDDRHAAADRRPERTRRRDPARHQSGQWAADGGAIVALDPKDGSILALASSPSYQPVGLQRPGDPAELAAQGLTPKTALDRNYPALNRAARRHVSAGLGLQAGHRDRGDPGAPDQAVLVLSSARARTGSRGHWAPRLPQLGPLRQPADGYADGDRPVVRHVLLPRRQQVLPAAEGPRPAAPAVGAPLRVRAGQRLRPRPAGAGARADDRLEAAARSTDPIDKLWKPGDSIQLAIGQGDLTVTPLQMARFYAAIANGGKLVTPHVADGRREPERDDRAGHRAARAPAGPALDPANLKVVQQGLFEATHVPFGHLVRRVRQLPRPDRRQDRDGARRSSDIRRGRAAGPVVVVRLRARRRREARRLRRDRERRPRRNSGGARRRARSSRRSSTSQPRSHRERT